MAGGSTTQQERAIEIYVDDFAPFGGIKVDDIESVWSTGGASVIHDDVEATELCDRLSNERIDSVSIGNVADNWNATLAKRTDFIGNRFDIAPTGGLLIGGIVGRSTTRSGDHDIATGAR